MEAPFHDESEDFAQTLGEIMSLGDQDFSAAFDNSGITPSSVLNGGTNAITGILGDTLADHPIFEETSADVSTSPNDLIHEVFNTEIEVLYWPFDLPQNYSFSVDTFTEMDICSSCQTCTPAEPAPTYQTSHHNSTSLASASLQFSHVSRPSVETAPSYSAPSYSAPCYNAPSYTAPVYDTPVTPVSSPIASTTTAASSPAISSVSATSIVQDPARMTRRRKNWPREEWNTLESLVTQHTSPSTGMVSWRPVYHGFRLAFPNTTRQDRDLQMKVWRQWDKLGIKKRPNYRRSRK